MMLLQLNLLCYPVSARVCMQIIVCKIFICIWVDHVIVFSKNELVSLKTWDFPHR